MVGSVTTIAYAKASARRFNGSDDHITRFTGFLPTLLNVSDANGTDDSGASYSTRTESVKNSFSCV
jgi:hypothetical protein